jgi:hypothetical protein
MAFLSGSWSRRPRRGSAEIRPSADSRFDEELMENIRVTRLAEFSP